MQDISPSLRLDRAQESDLPSLTTIHSRIFHPISEFHRNVLPDTPAMRQWWRNSYLKLMHSSSGNVLVVRDANDEEKVVGMLICSRYEANEKGPGSWLMDDVTPDHDPEVWPKAVGSMAAYREYWMLGQPHFLIELLGVEGQYQGQGVGTALIRRCCELADAEGVAIFVDANENAMGFYRKHRFEPKKAVKVLGNAPRTLIRPKQSQRTIF